MVGSHIQGLELLLGFRVQVSFRVTTREAQPKFANCVQTLASRLNKVEIAAIFSSLRSGALVFPVALVKTSLQTSSVSKEGVRVKSF